MMKLALGALLSGIAVACLACGGGDPQLLDASSDAGQLCNPMLQTGCMAGEKCTWIVDADAPARFGHVGCKPDGATPLGGSCDVATAAGGGVDTCVAGTLCVSGTCKTICDQQLVEGSAPGACPVNYACNAYGGFFISGNRATAGVCDTGCDPLTQRLKVGTTGSVEACGSQNAVQPTATCVPGPGFRVFACTPSGQAIFPEIYSRTDREPPYGPTGGGFYPNGCAPGFIPFYPEDSTSMRVICTGMCAPVKVDKGIAAIDGNAKLNQGDPNALGKLVTDPAPVAGHATCAPGIKGSMDEADEDCRFFWLPIIPRGSTMPRMTPYNNTLGVCLAYSRYIQVDTNGDGRADAPLKSCAQLGTTPDPVFGTAEQNGCYPLPVGTAALQGGPLTRLGSRLPYGAPDGELVRHIFD